MHSPLNPALVLGICFTLVLYTWGGYPLVLWCLSRFRTRADVLASAKLKFSIVVAVHNEEEHIAAKIADCQRLDYPADEFELLIASEGSTDATEDIGRLHAISDPRIKLISTVDRVGKSGAQNLAVQHATGDVLLFTDVRTQTRPDLLSRLAEWFSNPKIGLVAPVAHFGSVGDAVSRGQIAYWRYELLLRQFESDLGILATASGQAFAVRRELFRPLPVQFGDDCIVPLDVRLQGFRVVQDPKAEVWDEMPHSIAGEFRARVRMTTRNWSGILSRGVILNPLRFPFTAWGLISHKFLRWMTPFFLLAALLCNTLLAFEGVMVWLLGVQLGFYTAALAGRLLSRGQTPNPVLGYPFAFCLANAGFLLGVVRSLRRQEIVAYK